jgi:release factor glutamine methyltransferase
MKISSIFLNSVKILSKKNIKTAKLDVKLLISFMLKIDVVDIFKHFDDEIDEKKFHHFLKRRLKGEPIANIINKKGFWDTDFYVNKDVLTPRPDSETLIEAVITHYKNTNEKLKILDLGTGSGCLLLSLLKIYKNSTGIGVDISKKALKVAKKNAKDFANVKLIHGNWNKNIEEKFDIIVSNPPYLLTDEIKKLPPEVSVYNPIISLDGGKDGLNCYSYLAKNIRKNMHQNSLIFLEIGINQKEAVGEIFKDFKFCNFYKDINDIERVLVFSY